LLSHFGNFLPENNMGPISRIMVGNKGHGFYLNNSLFISWLLSCLVEKKYFHGNMGTNKIEGAPLA
jgi:hypothetical protein